MTGETILIVDDIATNTKLAKILLTAEGYQVSTALNAEEALKVLETIHPHLILMDLQLPGKSGLTLAKELKSNPKFADIVIVALTAYAMKGDEAKAKASGCDGYMTKPISVATFVNDIAGFLKGKSPSLPEVVAKIENNLLILIIEDNPNVRKMLKKSLESEHYDVVEAADAASALHEASIHTFDLIIQDLILPDMDGFALNQKLRAIPSVKNIPIFALSGFLITLDIQDQHTGFTTFLLKPIEPSYLLSVVKAHLPIAALSKTLVGKGKHVLIADDNPIQLKLFSIQLRNLGFEVTTAQDGVIAFREAKERAPDVIISDILMPNMDGFSLCLEIKRDPALRHIPVILLTSHYLEDDDLALAKKAGASCYLTRTPDVEKFTSALFNTINEESPVAPDALFELTDAIKAQHAVRSIRQLEQQVLDNTMLAQRCAMLMSQLSLIDGIAHSLTSSSQDIDESLKDVFYFCLDAAGISRGALYLKKTGNQMTLSQHIGYSDQEKDSIASVFDASALVSTIIEHEEPFVIPSEKLPAQITERLLALAKVKSAFILPLFSSGECLGLLLLGSDQINKSNADIMEFIKTLGVQFAQSIALASAFDKLRFSETRYRQLVEISPYAIFIEQDEKFVYANDAALTLVGAKNQHAISNHSLYDFIHSDDRALISNNIHHHDQKISTPLFEIKLIDINGVTLDVEVVMSPLVYQGSTATYMIMRDITERKRSALHLEIQYNIAWTLAESATLFVATERMLKIICERLQWDCGAIWAIDGKEDILRCTRFWQMPHIHDQTFQKITQELTYAKGAGLPGQVWQTQKACWKSDLSHEAHSLRHAAATRLKLNSTVAFPIIYDDKVLGVIELFCTSVIPPNEALLLWFESIGSQFGVFLIRKHMEKQMLYLAEHDALTGLSNRSLMEQYLNTALATAKEGRQKLAILFIDIDNFKYINDSMGHQVGDCLLKEISLRMAKCFRAHDTVSRFGGDEFVITLPNIHNNEEVVEIIKRLQHQLTNAIHLSGKEFFITISIGVSFYPENGDSAQDLIKNADIAMYTAKAKGRNNFQFCTPDIIDKAESRGTLESSLKNALENHEFILYYQPKIGVATQKITGMEALIRWKQSDGILLPGSFIAAAEDSDLIVPIGEWVLETAYKQNCQWQADGLAPITMSINLSVRNLNKEFLVAMEKTISATPLVPGSFEVELTEGALMGNVESNINILRSLKDMGVKISIDDFGTGYSSLSYLKRFPIDIIKIDQSFVRDIATDPDDAAIVTAIIAMARSLSFKVIAEGVETEEQLKFLCEHGCDEIQGYYFSRPIPADEATNFIKTAKIKW